MKNRKNINNNWRILVEYAKIKYAKSGRYIS